MIKARAEGKNGMQLVLVGIAEVNVERLKEGKPILVKGAEIGLPNLEIMIAYEPTEEMLVEKMNQNGLIGPETVVWDQRKPKN